MYPETTIVFTSFDKRPLRFFQSTFPDADLMFITKSPCCDASIKEALDLGVKRLGCTWDGSSRASVRAAHDAGLFVSGWPGRSVFDYLLGLSLGFDRMYSDNPVDVLAFKRKILPLLREYCEDSPAG